MHEESNRYALRREQDCGLCRSLWETLRYELWERPRQLRRERREREELRRELGRPLEELS